MGLEITISLRLSQLFGTEWQKFGYPGFKFPDYLKSPDTASQISSAIVALARFPSI